MIFGYKQLTISLYYLHNSAKCFADVQFSDKIVDSEGFEADDVMTALNPWLPTDFRAKKEQFLGDLQDENHSEMFGEVIDTFENQGSKWGWICRGFYSPEIFRNVQNHHLRHVEREFQGVPPAV